MVMLKYTSDIFLAGAGRCGGGRGEWAFGNHWSCDHLKIIWRNTSGIVRECIYRNGLAQGVFLAACSKL